MILERNMRRCIIKKMRKIMVAEKLPSDILRERKRNEVRDGEHDNSVKSFYIKE